MTPSAAPQPKTTLLLICYLGFVSLGLPDPLIGVAWPSIRSTFGLSQNEVSWIFIGAGCSYFVSSFFAGRLLKVLNVGVLLALSSALVAAAAFNYAAMRIWILFAMGSVLHGLGSGAIDTGLNHYVAHHFSARHMNWLHASYSVGAMLGPMLMTWAITAGGSYRLGYFIVAIILLALSVLFVLTNKLWNDPGKPATDPTEEARHHSSFAALRLPLVRLQVILFFVYTGLEVAIGQWTFTVLTDNRAIAPQTAGFWVTLYWAGILAGRIVFGFVVDRIGIDTLIRTSMVAATAGTALFLWPVFPGAMPLALLLSGIGLAAIFPSLMTRTPQRLGKELAAHAIGFQVGAAMIGAAVIPSVTGAIAQTSGLGAIPPTLLAVAILLFGIHETVLRTAPVGRSPN